MKKLFQFCLLFLGVSLFFTNCEKEDVFEEQQKQSPYEVSLNFFKEQTNIHNLTSYLKIKQQTTETLRSGSDNQISLNDFDIDTTLVKSLELSENRLSFSFKITPRDNNIVEGESYNLFIRQINDDWVSSIFLFIEDTDTTNNQRFSSITEVYAENGIANTNSVLRGGAWVETTHYHCNGCIGVCDSCGRCVTYSVTYLTTEGDLGGDIGGGTGEGYGDGGVYNDGGGGGGGSASSTPDAPCDPRDLTGDCLYNALDYVVEVKNCLGDQLTDDAENWLDNTDNYQQMIQIRSYLNEALCSDEAQAFVLEAIEAVEDGGEIDIVNEVILDSTFVNNQKLKCVYDKLTEDNNSLFRSTIGAFIDNPSFNITFKVGNCIFTEDACTNDSDPHNIEITIEDINANPLELAQLILHEAIHAEIAKFVAEYQAGVNVNNRPYLFQLYAHYKGWSESIDPDFNWSNAADHQYMILNYVNNIASALRQFDNNRYPLDNYKSYAWDGLRDNYNYSGTLTQEQEEYYTNLRATQTNIGIQVCNQ